MIRLAMLARDEAERMAGVAEACGELVDDVVVLIDDRTTDGTELAIAEAFGGPAVATWQRFRFEHFAQARNALFDVARKGLRSSDYLLLVDPDSPPRGTIDRDALSLDVYECEWDGSGMVYTLPILVRAGAHVSYSGACHEVLGGHDTYGRIDTLRVEIPAKEANPERMAFYLELLEDDRHTDPRAAFYYARTLDVIGRKGDAIGAYLQRAQMLGWDEETFYSLYSAGVLMRAFDLELAQRLLERARAYRPTRLEPVFELARIANEQRRHGEALELAATGLRMPPSSDRLFVHRWCERDGLRAQLAVATGELAALADTLLSEVPHG